MTDVISTTTRDYNGLQIPTPGTFALDPAHTRVGFVARHLMVSKVRGSFTDVTGEIVIAEDPIAVVGARHHAGRVHHDRRRAARRPPAQRRLPRGREVPDPGVPQHRPDAKGGNEFTLRGDLTIKGVTHPVDLAVEFEGVTRSPWGKDVIGFSAKTEIDREAWGMTWNQALETGGVMVSKKITIEIEGEAVRQD